MNLFKASDFIAQRLSANESVWIAQKQGRSKDGLDKTDPAVLKMLHIALRKNALLRIFQNTTILFLVQFHMK